MPFRTDIKKKEIRIQKQAQSLTAFQSKVAHGYDDRAALLKRLLAAAAALALALAAIVSWRLWRSHKIEQHETALAALLLEVQGDRPRPDAPDADADTDAAGRAQRMRAALPRLDDLARTAPAPCAPVANGMAAAWRLALAAGPGGPAEADAPGDAPGDAPKDPPKDPNDPPRDAWSRIRLARRSVALGRAQEASDLIAPLHRGAAPGRAWSGQYWDLLMQVRQLEGDRDQALRDYADYRRIFKGHPDAKALDKALAGV
jgi:hypothetical protein